MTYQEIAAMIESMGFPFVYNSFPNNEAPQLPYIVFNYPDRNDFGADNINYSKISILNLELYTASKDFDLEKRVEAVLEQNGFFYEKSEAYIRKENTYQVSYVMQFTVKEL
jgi:hypothetical protein